MKFNESEKEKESEGKTETETDDDHVYRIELDFSDKCETMIDSDNCTTEEPSVESVPRRSERERQPLDFYGIRINVTSQNLLRTQMHWRGPENLQWQKAMETEMQSLKENIV